MSDPANEYRDPRQREWMHRQKSIRRSVAAAIDDWDEALLVDLDEATEMTIHLAVTDARNKRRREER